MDDGRPLLQAEVGSPAKLSKKEEKRLRKVEKARAKEELKQLKRQKKEAESKAAVAQSAQATRTWTRTQRSVFSYMPRAEDFAKTGATAPDWSKHECEPALRHTFDPEHRAWVKTPVVVAIAPKPFACGGMRRAHFMRMMTAEEQAAGDESGTLYVAKFFHNHMGEYEEDFVRMYFQDVEQQMIAKYYGTANCGMTTVTTKRTQLPSTTSTIRRRRSISLKRG
eukprot:TRINITY_DN6839_c0_g1_i2.p1 TRINITY_DN6839_c0_g1~~TRINITY_DN6839_c0_g1_i2.p1  ORF type:complete len:243 (-),score=61.57 TRINITY_DN6839_c0_g1_i2:517-1185(-)